ncbi:hypothetical protein HF086_014153 [Spodoptera exigua]|uniref:L-serine deaminase n=1 Tax=Spodoptera exigua TaxID=7107 RepID=A0A922SJF2_SPOEX|nr:hypothetical protein HF086_014153 [Spodoptera exigua]
MPKKRIPPPLATPSIDVRETLGLSPAVLGKRDFAKKDFWCPYPPSIDFDPYCDPHNPKAVLFSHVVQADKMIKSNIDASPLLALAYQGQLLEVHVTVVLPEHTQLSIISHCEEYGATIILHGKNIDEAREHAFKLMHDEERHGVYINGYDHPNVIAAAGSIGVEILDQLPDTEAILVPVGGGGLIAGIAAFVKHANPNILIYVMYFYIFCIYIINRIVYSGLRPRKKDPSPKRRDSGTGIEPGRSCSFSKAMHNERPYKIDDDIGLASSLNIHKVGFNAFHTARSLIDKMVLIHNDFTARAIVHLIEQEKLIAEGAGAISLGALMCMPDILTELRGKKVVCIVSGGNIDLWPLKRATIHGKAVEHRVIPLNLVITPRNIDLPSKVFKIFKTMDCNILHSEFNGNHDWLEEGKLMQHSEDCDECCDPENPKIIQYDDIVDATQRIRPYVANTPIVGRGILNALQLLPADKKKLGVVMASSGNEALALSYHASKMNIPVIVILPISIPIAKIQRCHIYGAKVIMQGSNLQEAQKYARALAKDKGLTYINGRDHPHILAGYGSMALEILETTPCLDALIVPVGSGGLAAATATVVKHLKPSVLIYVGVRNDPVSKSKLLSLIASGGYNIHRHFQDNSWTNGTEYFVEMKIVCEAKGLAHALELKRTIERAYPCTAVFENEPFNDKRTCPCHTKKIT